MGEDDENSLWSVVINEIVNKQKGAAKGSEQRAEIITRYLARFTHL